VIAGSGAAGESERRRAVAGGGGGSGGLGSLLSDGKLKKEEKRLGSTEQRAPARRQSDMLGKEKESGF
jgi:hypothetical protein